MKPLYFSNLKPVWDDQRYRRIGLPHFDTGNAIQHITYHLADALPSMAVRRFVEQSSNIPQSNARQTQVRRLTESWLDAGHGTCVLREGEIASMITESWRHFDGERYHLLSYVVMPNHCHVLVQPTGLCPLSQIVLSWKSYSARRINEWKAARGVHGAKNGRVWQRDYWDRYVRNLEHYHRVVEYIENNPVAAGLVTKKEDWAWSSAN